MTAEGIREHVPDAHILNKKLEMWGIDEVGEKPLEYVSANTWEFFSLDIDGLTSCLDKGLVDSIIIDSYTYNVDHYPARAKCRGLFPPTVGCENIAGFGDHELVCNIRGGEILTGVHKDYFPLPVEYYKLVQNDCGLNLIFYGQIDENEYTKYLRSCFPEARFIGSQSPEADFEIIRRSKNIALSISTFSWLAAWLSDANRIYFPVGGMFNPTQHPNQTFIPIDEPSYKYVLLPICKASNLYEDAENFWKLQNYIGRFASFVGIQDLSELLDRAEMTSHRVLTKGFEPSIYCNKYPNVSTNVLSLKASALTLFMKNQNMDRKELYKILSFDEEFYSDTYPDAVRDVALGRFDDIFSHYAYRGKKLGYRSSKGDP